MLKILEFMNQYKHKITEFTQSFNGLLVAALEKLKNRQPNDSLPYLKKAYEDLQELKHKPELPEKSIGLRKKSSQSIH
jgi:hypothetical protein